MTCSSQKVSNIYCLIKSKEIPEEMNANVLQMWSLTHAVNLFFCLNCRAEHVECIAQELKETKFI